MRQDKKRKGKFRKRRMFHRRKMCPFCVDKSLIIDFKSPFILKRFITERGKIIPRRISGVCARHQRRLSVEIKRARNIALMPFTTITAT